MYSIECIYNHHIYRYSAKLNLHSPNLPSKYFDQEREAYKATRDKPDEPVIFKKKK